MFDKIYELVNHNRAVFHTAVNKKVNEQKKNNKEQVLYLEDYIETLSLFTTKILEKVAKEISRGLDKLEGSDVTV